MIRDEVISLAIGGLVGYIVGRTTMRNYMNEQLRLNNRQWENELSNYKSYEKCR